MEFSSLLTDDQLPLVIDTSVVINLHACTYGVHILSAIPNVIIVPQIAAAELKEGTNEQLFLQNLVNAGIVTLSELTDDEYEVFGDLISNSPTVDDGEAATIAIAYVRNAFPIIDDRKGRARATGLKASLEPGWSLDLFRHPLVISHLGAPAEVDAVYLALRDGRMRIPIERANDVIALIGDERSIDCKCLPGYRDRYGQANG